MQVLIRGGGDLASGIAVRLHRSGFHVLITELPQPLVIRRSVSFAEAVPEGSTQVEDITGQLINDVNQSRESFNLGQIPILVDPDLSYLKEFNPEVIVDARMLKKPPGEGKELASLVIGLGPGFNAGVNCHAVIETNRGHNLGRVIWEGEPESNTGIPGVIGGYGEERVLRAPSSGILHTKIKIGDRLMEKSLIAEVDGQEVLAPFEGTLRGLLRNGTHVEQGLKIGDLDPRDDPSLWVRVSDKSRSIGGGVLEAILACPDLRSALWIS